MTDIYGASGPPGAYYDPNAPRLTTGAVGSTGYLEASTPQNTQTPNTAINPYLTVDPTKMLAGYSNPNPIVPTSVVNNPPPPPPAPTGQTDQQKWEAAGHAGTAPVGYHGESGPSTGGIDQAAIDAAYNPQNEYLNSQESQLRADQPNVLQDAMSQFGVALSGLDTSKAGTMGQITLNANQANEAKDNALTAARRMYDELRRGYQQRFGGSTSAGQASSEIASVEQQRQQGLTQRNYADTTAKIDQQKLDVENNYTQNKLQLESQKTTAINQVNRDFQNQLMAIQGNRTQLATAKAQASLQALQDMRNQVFAINSQATQYQQTLDAQKAQSQQSLETYAKQLQLSGQGSQSAINSFLAQPQATNQGLTVQQGGTQTTNPLVGSIKKPQDLTGQISSPQLTQFNEWNKILGQ